MRRWIGISTSRSNTVQYALYEKCCPRSPNQQIILRHPNNDHNAGESKPQGKAQV